MKRLASIAVLLGLAGSTGCVTPSIPIPPPDPSEMTFHLVTSGQVTTATLSYPPTAAYKNGTAYLYDQNLHHGSIDAVAADGSVTSTIPANLGDQVVFTVENDKQSVSTCVILREGTQDPTQYCQ